MDKDQKRMGRPTKPPEPNSRVSLGLRVSAEIKNKLDQAAKENCRTQSQEAEYRLRKSFEELK